MNRIDLWHRFVSPVPVRMYAQVCVRWEIFIGCCFFFHYGERSNVPLVTRLEPTREPLPSLIDLERMKKSKQKLDDRLGFASSSCPEAIFVLQNQFDGGFYRVSPGFAHWWWLASGRKTAARMQEKKPGNAPISSQCQRRK